MKSAKTDNAKRKRGPVRFIAAAVQMNSQSDPERNLETALRQIDRAAGNGARFVALPENFLQMRAPGVPATFRAPLDGPVMRRLAAAAGKHKIHLLAGSVPEPARGKRWYNTSVLFGPDGAAAGIYRKIHLFDVDLPGGEKHRESEAVRPGREIVVARTRLGTFGLSVCYDLRFPELYRRLAARGAGILCVPSAFTRQTGEAHWETLLRARAIENLAYVIAPGQCGAHPGGRRTFGHSLLIDPWGAVLARAWNSETIIYAKIDTARIKEVRANLPALRHIRPHLFSPADMKTSLK